MFNTVTATVNFLDTSISTAAGQFFYFFPFAPNTFDIT